MAISDINIGSVPNDGTGDSIRDAFDKVNNNFAFLDDARQNLTTGNLTATGNISLRASVPSYWTGTYFLNGVQIATVGTLFSGGTVADPTIFQATTPSTSNITGAVTVAGGLGVAGPAYLTALNARSLVVEQNISGATLSVGGVAQFDAAVATGNLTTTGTNSTSGNLTAANTAAFKGTFTQVAGTLLTNAQPHVTSLGTLVDLAVTGNISAANITLNWGQISATRAVITGNAIVGSNLLVTGTSAVTGNLAALHVISGIGTFANLTVTSIPTVKSVTTKEYVTSTVVGFAIGLGS
jgi:hypothetical protein